MSWHNELITITRTLINDLDEPYDYSDSRIEQILVVAAKYLQFDINLDYDYTIDVTIVTINPEPPEPNDSTFISMVCLKAACIIDQGTFRTKSALEGIRTALGPASVSIGGSLAGWQAIIDHGACGLYEELTSHWDVKNATAIRAVLSPFVGNKFDPRYLLRGPIRDRTNNDFYG